MPIGNAVDSGWPPPIDAGVPYSGPTTPGMITVSRGTTVGRLAAGFAGFSFEKSHVTDGFFTGSNAPLIALFRLLGPGLVRIGANDVNKTRWMATTPSLSGGATSAFIGTADVDGLAAFLKAADWKVLYGLDMTLESAPWTNDVAEATYAAGALGANLYAFEMGNEAGDVTTYSSNWKGIQSAVHAAVPTAQFSGGETAGPIGRATQFAGSAGSLSVLLTHHRYLAGAGDPNATMAYMLGGDATLGSDTKTLAAAAAANGVRDGFRWGENNSFFRHGQPGVSNAVGSALWGIEHMLTVAENGGVGVNFHGGGDNQDGNNCPNGHASCSKPFVYSPIAEASSQVTGAAPLYYGMLFVARAGTGNLLATSVSAGGLNVKAHAISLSDGSTNVVIVNNDANSGVTASVNVGVPVASASAIYLQGPALTATTGVTLAGAGVSASGSWIPTSSYALPANGNVVTVVVPPGSAALVHAQ